MNLDPYIRQCQVIRVIDADTLRLRIDLGWNQFSDHNVRLLRVNAPELKGDTREAGLDSKMWVINWLQEKALDESITAWPFIIHSQKSDSFGRYLGEIYSLNGDNLNDDLIKSGHGIPFTVTRG